MVGSHNRSMFAVIFVTVAYSSAIPGVISVTREWNGKPTNFDPPVTSIGLTHVGTRNASIISYVPTGGHNVGARIEFRGDTELTFGDTATLIFDGSSTSSELYSIGGTSQNGVFDYGYDWNCNLNWLENVDQVSTVVPSLDDTVTFSGNAGTNSYFAMNYGSPVNFASAAGYVGPTITCSSGLTINGVSSFKLSNFATLAVSDCANTLLLQGNPNTPNCGILEEYTIGGSAIRVYSTYAGPANGLAYLVVPGSPIANPILQPLDIDISAQDSNTWLYDVGVTGGKLEILVDGNGYQTHITDAPTGEPTAAPTIMPTSEPTRMPTAAPVTESPTSAPTSEPTNYSNEPTVAPVTDSPTPRDVTAAPVTESPTPQPTSAPSMQPSISPTDPGQTFSPTTEQPTSMPTTEQPTSIPTSSQPTNSPTSASPTSAQPTGAPTSAAPSTSQPTNVPSTASPTTLEPTDVPTTAAPTTLSPTNTPTPPTTASPTSPPTTTAPTSSVNNNGDGASTGASSDDGGGNMMVIIIAAAAGLLLCIVLALVVKKCKSTQPKDEEEHLAKTGRRSKEQAVFDNPMYEMGEEQAENATATYLSPSEAMGAGHSELVPAYDDIQNDNDVDNNYLDVAYSGDAEDQDDDDATYGITASPVDENEENLEEGFGDEIENESEGAEDDDDDDDDDDDMDDDTKSGDI